MKGYNLLWITLIILSMEYLRETDAFQCYECENCPTIGENEKKFLRECRLPESPTRLPIPTTTTVASEEQVEELEEEEEDKNPETSSSSTSTSTTTSTSTSTSTSTTTSTSTSTPTPTPTDKPISTTASTSISTSTPISTSAVAQKTTQGIQAAKPESNQASSESSTSQEKKKGDAWSIFPHSIEENELINSRPEQEDVQHSKEVNSRSARQLPGTKPACYILKVKYDGFEVVNRGCGPALEDRNLTCKMLSKGQPYAECNVCEGDMCNSGSRVKSTLMGTLFVLFVILINSW